MNKLQVWNIQTRDHGHRYYFPWIVSTEKPEKGRVGTEATKLGRFQTLPEAMDFACHSQLEVTA